MSTNETAQAQGRQAVHGPSKNLVGILHRELSGLISPVLWMTVAGLTIIFLIVAQLPRHYSIDAGYEEGIGSDLPFLQGFNNAETDSHGSYRWTDDGATIQLPGFGRRAAIVQLSFIPIGEAAQTNGPQTIEIYAGPKLVATLPVRYTGSLQSFVVPVAVDGQLELTIHTATFSPPGDPRTLGTPLDRVTIWALPGGIIMPDWTALLSWLGAVILAWMAVRCAFGNISTHRDAPAGRLYGVFGVGAGLIALAALLDPARWAFGATAGLLAAGLGYLLAIGLRALLPALLRRFRVPLDAWTLGWLVLFCVLSFGLRYGGRLYPNSMHGDIGFHINRFNDAVWGLINIVSVNRGVEFPYPPGPYLLIAPFALLGVEPGTLLQLGAAIVDALSPIIVYAIATRVMKPRPALLAAGVYVFTAATFMTTWWSFDTHIYTQFVHLLLIAGIIWAAEAWQQDNTMRRHRWTMAVGVLLCLVFLGHFGFLINTALLVGILLVGTWLQSWRGAAWARALRWPLSLAFGGAVLFVGLFFYSAYIPLFLGQLQTASNGGLAAVAGRTPVSRAVIWETLWRNGLLIHFGLFPLPLAIGGIWLLWRGVETSAELSPARVVLSLMLGSLLVGFCFAVLPFITLATNSPRWILFIAWVVAIGTALMVEQLWQTGLPARMLTLAMGALVLANSAWIWLAPMLWRIRPPEPS